VIAMRLAICNETYQDLAFAEVCADVAACGYDGIEVALSAITPDPRRLQAADARALGAMAADAGLSVVGLHWLLAAPGGMHLTTADAGVRHRTVQYLSHLARLCAAMGGSVMVLGSPKQREVLPGDTRDAAFARAVAACRSVAGVAGDLGVTLAIEPLGPAYTNFLTTAAQARDLIQAVDHPACRLHLDVFAMTTEALPIPEIIAAHADHLAHFHANSPDQRGPGSGGFDFGPIAAALRAADYQGFVSVEVFDYAPGGPAIARDSIECLRRAFA
jgi:sugar phosphate isomerase/epimerase